MWSKVSSYIHYLVGSYDLVNVLIELALIGFGVYAVMRFLRGTGGEKLFKGIVFLLLGVWAISLATRALNLDLERIALLFRYLFWAVVVVAAVAFQQEIRRGLIQLGGTRFGRTNTPEMVKVIESVVDAASALSRRHIGALIAFEREVGLGDLVSTGTRLNAEVSDDLLLTIFWPGSPLHDMGVVVRRNRLAAAGVQFPLAEHGEYDRTLGSRHRAAIGLSKATDAAVVVVSEETGHIALAANGKLARMLTVEQLRRQLLDLVIPLLADDQDKKKTASKPREAAARPAGDAASKASEPAVTGGEGPRS